MIIPDSSNPANGHYLGTEIDQKWWKRYTKDTFFARGNGEYWCDASALCFRRYSTKHAIKVPFAKITHVKIGKAHAGRWPLGRPVLKLIWEKDRITLNSGFIFSRNRQEAKTIKAEIERRLS